MLFLPFPSLKCYFQAVLFIWLKCMIISITSHTCDWWNGYNCMALAAASLSVITSQSLFKIANPQSIEIKAIQLLKACSCYRYVKLPFPFLSLVTFKRKHDFEPFFWRRRALNVRNSLMIRTNYLNHPKTVYFSMLIWHRFVSIVKLCCTIALSGAKIHSNAKTNICILLIWRNLVYLLSCQQISKSMREIGNVIL